MYVKKADREKNKLKEYAGDKIENRLKRANLYNETYGTKLSYGEYAAKEINGWLEPEFKKLLRKHGLPMW